MLVTSTICNDIGGGMRLANKHSILGFVGTAFPKASSSQTKIAYTVNTSNSLTRWHSHQVRNMASPTKICLTPADTGVFKFQPQNEETASVASRLLQKNHDEFHIFFNSSGFHNHIAHHILSLYGLGAPASVLEKQFERNASYQMPLKPVTVRDVNDMTVPENFNKFLGQDTHYHDFLSFFQRELEVKGVKGVLKEYLFAGDTRADDMLVRLFSGFLHPIIHLGFGLEFNQPAIVAEALAETAVHSNWMARFFIGAEEAADARGTSKTSLLQLIEEIRNDQELSMAPRWDDGNKIRDGIMKRALDKAIGYASQWTVSEQDLESKTVEMINTAIYYTAAAQHPPKQVKFDFYFMHCVNASIFWSTFNSLSWLSLDKKIRLLEWKGRNDLIMYASRRSPRLLVEEITGYVPKDLKGGAGEWNAIFTRLFDFEDDGHAIKLGRAVAHGEAVSRKYENKDWCKVKGFMWLKIGNMVIDSVEDDGEHWARSVGFDEAWTKYQDRQRHIHL